MNRPSFNENTSDTEKTKTFVTYLKNFKDDDGIPGRLYARELVSFGHSYLPTLDPQLIEMAPEDYIKKFDDVVREQKFHKFINNRRKEENTKERDLLQSKINSAEYYIGEAYSKPNLDQAVLTASVGIISYTMLNATTTVHPFISSLVSVGTGVFAYYLNKIKNKKTIQKETKAHIEEICDSAKKQKKLDDEDTKLKEHHPMYAHLLTAITAMRDNTPGTIMEDPAAVKVAERMSQILMQQKGAKEYKFDIYSIRL